MFFLVHLTLEKGDINKVDKTSNTLTNFYKTDPRTQLMKKGKVVLKERIKIQRVTFQADKYAFTKIDRLIPAQFYSTTKRSLIHIISNIIDRFLL